MQYRRLDNGILHARGVFEARERVTSQAIANTMAQAFLLRNHIGRPRPTALIDGHNRDVPVGLTAPDVISDWFREAYLNGSKLAITGINMDTATQLASSVPAVASALAAIASGIKNAGETFHAAPRDEQVVAHLFFGGGDETETASKGFDPHFDVGIGSVIVALNGEATWAFGQRLTRRPAVDGFAEFGPSITELIVEAGDVLFIPPGLVHQVRAHGTDTPSLHLAVGDLYGSAVVDSYHQLFAFLLREEVISDVHVLESVREFLSTTEEHRADIGPTEVRERVCSKVQQHLLDVGRFTPVEDWLDDRFPLVFDQEANFINLIRKLSTALHT